MNITELSVGNWVLYKDTPVQVNTCFLEINQIGFHFGKGYEFSNVGDLKPMPLTDEILELNGAIKKPLDEYETDWNFFNTGCFIEKIYGTDHYDLEQYGDTIRIRYVHELQNLLKLFKNWKQEFRIE